MKLGLGAIYKVDDRLLFAKQLGIKVDMLQAMRCYPEAGFEGVLIDDHTPGVVGDSDWGHRGRAYSIGYMKALKRCAEMGG